MHVQYQQFSLLGIPTLLVRLHLVIMLMLHVLEMHAWSWTAAVESAAFVSQCLYAAEKGARRFCKLNRTRGTPARRGADP